MKAIDYMKIDYMLTKQQMRILPVMVVLSLLMGRAMGDVGILVGCSYLFFIATTFSITPYGSCHRRNTGFLLMLPGTVAERVAGRFLFGLSYIGAAAFLCAVFMGAFRLLGHEVTLMDIGLILCNIAFSVLIVALEYLISYVFGEGRNNWQYLGNVVRTAPGMGMFFLFIYIFEKMDGEAYVAERMEFLAQEIVSAGVLLLAAAFLFMGAAAAVSVKMIERRDYA